MATVSPARWQGVKRRSPRSRRARSGPRTSTSTACGRRGTRCTRPTPACATRIATPAIGARSTSSVKFARLGRARARADDRRPGPADAGDGVRRDERGARRPLRRHRRPALARSVEASSSTRRCSIRSSAARIRWTACTATRRCPKLLGSAARYAYAGDEADLARCRVLLGSRGQPPHVRHRRTWQGRVFPRARHAGQHHRGPHRGDLQRLQHAEADAPAVRAAAERPSTPSSTSARCSITSSARSIHRWRHVLHGAGRQRACAASIRT